jgi:hypothetical protein
MILVDIILGVTVFAALFLSSFSNPEKMFFGCAFLLLMFSIDVHALQSDTEREHQIELLFRSLKSLENRMAGSTQSIGDTTETYLKELKLNALASGKGAPYVALYVEV